MARRADVLTLAVLGLLHDSPLHGYELRKRLTATLGMFHALSYGSLYPCLKQLLVNGWVSEQPPTATTTPAVGHPLTGRRGRIVYQLTADGKEHFAHVLAESGPSAWEDGDFDVRFAFFSRLDADTRLRILEGRRTRLEERLEGVRRSFARSRERWDDYTLELQRHGLESAEREVRWLDGLIDSERRGAPQPTTHQHQHPHHLPTTPPHQSTEGDT